MNIDSILQDLHIQKITGKYGKNLSTFRIGGELKNLIYVEDEKKLSLILKEFYKNNISYFILGNGSNFLFNDAPMEDIVIKLGENFSFVKSLSDIEFQIGASSLMPSLSKNFAKNSLTGFEFGCSLPSEFGGAVFMDACFSGQKMSDILKSVKICREDGKIEILKKDSLEILVKNMGIPKNAVIIDAIVKLSKESLEKIDDKIKNNIEYRLKTQPKFPSAGCIFKNPPNAFAGMLIDKAGLKGLSVGGATISTLHANWIVNPKMEATASDVKELMEIAKEKVYEKFKETLEPEVIIM